MCFRLSFGSPQRREISLLTWQLIRDFIFCQSFSLSFCDNKIWIPLSSSLKFALCCNIVALVENGREPLSLWHGLVFAFHLIVSSILLLLVVATGKLFCPLRNKS